MAFDTHANLIKVTVTAAPSPATSGTTLAISDTDRTALINAGLAAPFNMGAQPSSGASETNTEILRVTAIGAASSYNAGNTQLTVTRNAETTPGGARSIVVGDVMTLDITVKTITDIENNINGFIYDETPSGTVNGTNTTFTLANTPISGSLQLYRDGQLMNGGGNDYSLSGATITFTTAPVTGSVLLAYYSKAATGSGVNAATVNGYSANATPTANQIPVLNGSGVMPANTVNAASVLVGQFLKMVDTSHDYKIQFGTVATTAISSNQELDINITLGTAWSTKHVAFFAIGFPDTSWSGFGISGGGVVGGTSLTQGFVHFHNGSTAQNIINLCWISIGY